MQKASPLFVRRKSFAMRLVNFLPALCFGVCFCAGCNPDSGRAVPPQARNPYANRIDAENPPPPDTTEPEASAPIQMPSESELGLAVYPAAKPYKDEFGVGAVQIKAEGLVTAMLETDAPVDKVVAFYKKEMPKADRSDVTEDGKAVVRLTEPYGGNGMHLVEVSAANGKTLLTLQNLRPTKSAEALQSPASEINASAPSLPSSAPSSGVP
jgi:hypothetical protein